MKPVMRITAILVVVMILVVTLAACSNNEPPAQESSANPSSQPSSSAYEASSEVLDVSEANNEPEEEPVDDSDETRILIAYFAVAENSEVDAIASASVQTIDGEAMGTIRVLAEAIQENVGGDLFSIQTSVAYASNRMEVIDYAADEQANNERPALTASIDNLDDYDIIFIGYPIWWYDFPMVMYSFLEEYDFSGKTVIPFCTHNGSGFSSTVQTLESLQSGATILDGYTVSENSIDSVSSDVPEWLREIGLL